MSFEATAADAMSQALGRPGMKVWYEVLRPREMRTMLQSVLGSAWIYKTLKHDSVIASGPIRVGRVAALAPLRKVAKALEGVACGIAEMHSDEHLECRFHVMGLIRSPGDRSVRICGVLDDGRVEAAELHAGDVFVLDSWKAHAAHAKGFMPGGPPMVFWSLPLPMVRDRESAYATAEGIVRLIALSRAPTAKAA